MKASIMIVFFFFGFVKYRLLESRLFETSDNFNKKPLVNAIFRIKLYFHEGSKESGIRCSFSSTDMRCSARSLLLNLGVISIVQSIADLMNDLRTLETVK